MSPSPPPANSASLQKWRTDRAAHLDEFEAAHTALSEGRGDRQHAAVQLNFAYALMLSSEFQGFCRDLHTETTQHLFALAGSKHAYLAHVVRARLLEGRKLDQGNPNPGNIGSDFGRFGVDFWPLVEAQDADNRIAKAALDELAIWRNAIAHNDFTASKLGGKVVISLHEVRSWRSHTDRLAANFDNTMRDLLLDWWRPTPWDWR